MKQKQILSVLVENQAGVLNKITGLFARRAFNIDSLAVGVTEDESVSRITMIVDSGSHAAEQVEKQLHKLISVIKVKSLEEGDYVLMLSDGIISTFEEGTWLIEMLSSEKNLREPKMLLNNILKQARDKNIRKDDMSVLFMKVAEERR